MLYLLLVLLSISCNKGDIVSCFTKVISNSNITFFIEAAKNGDINTIKSLIQKRNIIVNADGKTINTALTCAAFGGRKDIVEALIRAGANVNYTKGPVMNALILAAMEGNIDIVNLLLQYGSNIDDQINFDNDRVNKQRFHCDILNPMKNYSKFYKTYIPSLKARAVTIMIKNHNYNLEMPGCDSVKPTLSLGDKAWLLHNTSNVEDRKFILSLDGDLGIPTR